LYLTWKHNYELQGAENKTREGASGSQRKQVLPSSPTMSQQWNSPLAARKI